MADFKVKIITDASQSVAGSQQAAEGLKGVGNEAAAAGKASVEASKEAVAADEKQFASKSQLKSAVEGLRKEFPELAHFAKLALNPIAFVVAGIGAAFALWQSKVEAVTHALAGVELPDIKERAIGQVTAAAEAWKKFGDAVKGAVDGYNGVTAASDRALKRMDAEAAQKKKLLEAEKGVELARLERDKSSMSEGDYQAKKLDIEGRYGAKSAQQEAAAREAQLAEKEKRAAALRASAEKKSTEAGGIHVATAEQDAATEADLKARRDAAVKSQADRRNQIKDLRALQEGEGNYFGRAWTGAKTGAIYGWNENPESVIGQINQGMGQDQTAIDQYNGFMGRKAGRNEARSRKDRLSGEAGKELGDAMVLGQQIPEERGAAAGEAATGGKVATLNSLASAYKAAAEAGAKEQELAAQVEAAVASGARVTMAMMQKLEAYAAAHKAMEARVQLLEAKSSPGY